MLQWPHLLNTAQLDSAWLSDGAAISGRIVFYSLIVKLESIVEKRFPTSAGASPAAGTLGPLKDVDLSDALVMQAMAPTCCSDAAATEGSSADLDGCIHTRMFFPIYMQ